MGGGRIYSCIRDKLTGLTQITPRKALYDWVEAKRTQSVNNGENSFITLTPGEEADARVIGAGKVSTRRQLCLSRRRRERVGQVRPIDAQARRDVASQERRCRQSTNVDR